MRIADYKRLQTEFINWQKPITTTAMKPKLLSFHGKQKIKDKYLKRVQQHYKLDEIIKSGYAEMLNIAFWEARRKMRKENNKVGI